jgi:hypothetical protein
MMPGQFRQLARRDDENEPVSVHGPRVTRGERH